VTNKGDIFDQLAAQHGRTNASTVDLSKYGTISTSTDDLSKYGTVNGFGDAPTTGLTVRPQPQGQWTFTDVDQRVSTNVDGIKEVMMDKAGLISSIELSISSENGFTSSQSLLWRSSLSGSRLSAPLGRRPCAHLGRERFFCAATLTKPAHADVAGSVETTLESG
jgi:hypothetical protein